MLHHTIAFSSHKVSGATACEFTSAHCTNFLLRRLQFRGVATTLSMIRGPDMCNYSSINRAPIPKKGSERNLIQGLLRASYASAPVKEIYISSVSQKWYLVSKKLRQLRNLVMSWSSKCPEGPWYPRVSRGLDSKIKSRLFQLLISHESAFARSTVELSAAATEHHRISLQHDYPIKCPIYKIPFNLRNEFRRQITDLEKAGIISKSNSQYNTPALFVKQKEKWRLVLDFRKLNEITLTQDFVIPTLDDILHEISGSNYFSALDMKSAFNQIPLHFADRHKTAFSTPDGDKYEFNRLCVSV
ncbi:retrovirus-related Pol polyprotein from transposon opus [Trichonephila clavipes]|nr:retrovirus-related Pol polyprotein from transposon opus [Trichonephila clavipes]